MFVSGLWRSVRSPAYIFAVLLLASSAGAAPGIRRTLHLAPPQPASLQLADSFLIPGSFLVRAGSVSLGEGSGGYRVDLFNSVIHLPPSVIADSLLLIKYRYLPLGIPRVFFHRVAPVPGQEVMSAGRKISSPVAHQVDLSTEGSLFVAGSKTIGIRFGAGKDPSLDQSLNVQLHGTLAGDVEVVASLSDENSPIQPEGTTAELKELDKVVIELRRKENEVSIGDCFIRTRGFQYLNLERKMQGILGSISQGSWRTLFAAASTKGEFSSVEFEGTEGKQGPYYLGDQLGRAGGMVVVLAGTERVWLDGRAVGRGSDRDYIIDYTTGALTFTERNLITAQSRISVDFQYTRENYRRTVYITTTTGPLSDAVTVRAGLFREADDASHPLEWTLSETERQALAEAGDDEESSSLVSFTYVGPGEGQYDTLHVVFLIPHESGTWTASFSPVGDGHGEYRAVGDLFEYYGPNGGDFLALPESTGVGDYVMKREVILFPGGSLHEARVRETSMMDGSDLGVMSWGGAFTATFYRSGGGSYVRETSDTWRYVGPGHGDYTVRRSIPIPHSLTTAVVGLDIGEMEHLGLSVEGAMARKDKNTLSDRDDEDNDAAALEAHLTASGSEKTFLPAWRANLIWRGQEAGFATPGRARPVDWARGWNSPSEESEAQSETQLQMMLGSSSGGNVAMSLAELRHSGTVDRRALISGRIVAPAGFRLSGRFNRSARTGGGNTRWWTDGFLSREEGLLGPVFRWKGEEISHMPDTQPSVSSGKGHMDVGYGFRVGRSARNLIRLMAGRRTMREFVREQEEWLTSQHGARYEMDLAVTMGTELKAKADITHTTTSYTEEFLLAQPSSAGDDVRNTVGAVRLTAAPVKGGPHLEMTYKASGREAEIMVEELVPEEEFETNVGEYDSLGHWVGPDAGTHKKILVPAGGAERVAMVEGTASVRLRPGGSSGPYWRRLLSSETSARIQASSTTDKLRQFYLLRPEAFANDSTTVRKKYHIEQRFEVTPPGTGVKVGIQWLFSNDEDHRRLTRRLHTRRERTTLRVRTPFFLTGRLDVALYEADEVRDEFHESEDEAPAGLCNRSKRKGITPSITTPLSRHLQLLAGGTFSEETAEQVQGTQESRKATLREFEANSGVRWTVPGRGRMTIKAMLSRLSVDGPWAQMASLYQRSDQEGTTRKINITGDYQLQEKLTLRLDFSYGSSPSQSRLFEGKMELIAYF